MHRQRTSRDEKQGWEGGQKHQATWIAVLQWEPAGTRRLGQGGNAGILYNPAGYGVRHRAPAVGKLIGHGCMGMFPFSFSSVVHTSHETPTIKNAKTKNAVCQPSSSNCNEKTAGKSFGIPYSRNLPKIQNKVCILGVNIQKTVHPKEGPSCEDKKKGGASYATMQSDKKKKKRLTGRTHRPASGAPSTSSSTPRTSSSREPTGTSASCRWSSPPRPPSHPPGPRRRPSAPHTPPLNRHQLRRSSPGRRRNL